MTGRRNNRRARRGVATILLAAIAATGVACHRDASEAPGPAVSAESHATDEAHRVTLGSAGAERAGVRTAVVARAEATTEIDAFGRVLDPLPLVEALHARGAARAAAALARAEHERVARLHREDQNASTRDLESARSAFEKATLDLADATARVTLAWGAAAEAGDALTDDLVAGRAALVRVDLPAGATVTPPPATVTLAAGGDRTRGAVARVLGRAPTTDPLLQGEAYFALLGDDPPRPGAVLAATVPRDAVPVAGVAVPASAVVWADGRPVVYVETATGEFERRSVTLGPRVDDRWIVTAGVAAGDHVVVAGAARLLSSEVLGSEPAAD